MEDDKAASGCLLLIALLIITISTGLLLGSWPGGLLVFGIILLLLTLVNIPS